MTGLLVILSDFFLLFVVMVSFRIKLVLLSKSEALIGLLIRILDAGLLAFKQIHEHSIELKKVVRL